MLFFSLLGALSLEEQALTSRLFEEYGKLIYEVAYKVLAKQQDAEDILDDVMISVMKHLDKFEDKNENEIVAQLVIYSRNAAINLYNKNKRRYQNESAMAYLNDEDDLEDIDIKDPGLSVEDIVLSRDTSRIINKYVKLLPRSQRDAVILVYGFGYSSVDAASILKMTANAMGLRLYKARKNLLKMAGGELYEYLK